jgi:hypothetical protein
MWAEHVAHVAEENNSQIKNNGLSQQLPQFFRKSRKKHQDYKVMEDLDYQHCTLYTH